MVALRTPTSLKTVHTSYAHSGFARNEQLSPNMPVFISTGFDV